MFLFIVIFLHPHLLQELLLNMIFLNFMLQRSNVMDSEYFGFGEF